MSEGNHFECLLACLKKRKKQLEKIIFKFPLNSKNIISFLLFKSPWTLFVIALEVLH